MLQLLRRTWPVVVEVDRTLPGPPEVVWRLITDWEHQDDWMLEASDFVVVGDQREGVGVEAEATVSIGGISTRDRVVVTVWEPNELLVIEHLGWVAGSGALRLRPLPDDPTGPRTHVHWVETLEPPPSLGLLGALGLSLFAPLMKRIFARDLRILESLVRVAARP